MRLTEFENVYVDIMYLQGSINLWGKERWWWNHHLFLWSIETWYPEKTYQFYPVKYVNVLIKPVKHNLYDIYAIIVMMVSLPLRILFVISAHNIEIINYRKCIRYRFHAMSHDDLWPDLLPKKSQC